MSQTLMEEAAPDVESYSAPAQPGIDSDLLLRWLPVVVLAAAVACGVGVYAWFLEHSRELWWSMGHDRHSHYMFGLNLALDLRTFDFVRLFHDFDRMRVWGPLHPVLVALIEFVAGPNHRLAVLPSLCGWILAIWCAFLIPRRLMTTGGNAAGLIAACCVAASPAHRAYATDVMLESLGAGLSLAAIYLYLVVLQEQSKRYAVLFGLTMTALFLHKYNYWLLVVFGLTLGEFARQPRAWWDYAMSLCRRDRLPAWIVGELKQPLNYLCLLFAGAAIAVVVTGGWTLSLGKFTMSAQEPYNFVTFAYIAFFLRVAWWWRKTGRAWSLDAMPTTLRTVMIWHLVPVMCWFLLPKRLGYFIWFLSPNNNDQQRESIGFMHGLPTYLTGLQTDYLPLLYGMYIFGVVLALGFLCWRSLKPGASALMFFFLIAAYLTCQHPMLKYRFMHSWIAAGWVIGSIGLVQAAMTLTGWIRDSWAPRAAGFVCVLTLALHGPVMLEHGQSQEGGPKPAEPSPLRITDTYLPALADAKYPTILSNVSTRFLWTWTFIEQHHHQNMAAEIKNFKAFEGNPDRAKQWLETTKSDALVLIDIRRFTTYDWKTDEYVELEAFHQALAHQSAWVLTQRWEEPEGVSITLWRKSEK
ncbi:MAG TPA: glycosyltransferase family 39 protein [Gemmataceae bacterium]|nr:glycosyltransferase family 39 protein [Gemmataceae bacterium]